MNTANHGCGSSRDAHLRMLRTGVMLYEVREHGYTRQALVLHHGRNDVYGMGQPRVGTGNALFLRRHAPAYPNPHGTVLESHSQLYQHAEWGTPTYHAEQDTTRTRCDDQGGCIRLRVLQLAFFPLE